MLDVFHDLDAIRYQEDSPNTVQNKVTLVRKTKLDIMNVHECKCSKNMPIDIIGLVECHDEKKDNCYFDENDKYTSQTAEKMLYYCHWRC